MAGPNRKSELKALFGGTPAAAPVVAPATPAVAPAPETKSQIPAADAGLAKSPAAPAPKAHEPAVPVQRAASGAVRAMGLSLSSITRDAEEARALRLALEEGERIVSLDTDKIDGSFVSDRLSDEERDDPDFLALVESVRESGQQVPILVRPHPEISGRYQAAYGHRRLKAARRLGVPVKVIVRALTDDELVLAQGKENAERRNLTFIERALFAQALVLRGFDRKLTGDALAVQKSELSRLLQVADGVPGYVARAIGPAPKVGRERWMAIGQLLSDGAGIEKANDEIHSQPFKALASDERFQRLFDRLQRSRIVPKPAPVALTDANGTVFARISRQGRGVKIEFSADADPRFVENISQRLTEDYASFTQTTKA